jgi:DNA polymerase-3 subunit delta
MNAEFKKIVQSLKMRQFATVYLADGEESYYLDKLSDYFENSILAPAERDFNLTILYGKEVAWQDVVSACRRFPMFAEKQVVILKDASQLKGGEGDDKGLNSLLGYIRNPSPSTIFLIEHPFKKADTRTRFVKEVKERGIIFTSDKIKEERLSDWIEEYGRETGFTIPRQEAELLASYLGADLKKIENEIEKIRINVPDKKKLDTDLIQRYIGISKEYNLFDFPAAITSSNHEKLYKMLSYFLANSKAAPMPLLIGTLYTHFNRLYAAHFVRGKSDKEIASALAMSPFFVNEILTVLPSWPLHRVEKCILLLAKYNTMAVGVNSVSDDRELLKELIGRLLE